nr:MAG TPA: hypothetical protein [Bacteriophage sp.]
MGITSVFGLMKPHMREWTHRAATLFCYSANL